jgi:hypothetical protein
MVYITVNLEIHTPEEMTKLKKVLGVFKKAEAKEIYPMAMKKKIVKKNDRHKYIMKAINQKLLRDDSFTLESLFKTMRLKGYSCSRTTIRRDLYELFYEDKIRLETTKKTTGGYNIIIKK